MRGLPKPDQGEAPADDGDHDRAPIHLARELDRVFLDRYVAGNLPLKGRRTAVLQIFLFWGFVGCAVVLSLNPLLLPRLIDAVDGFRSRADAQVDGLLNRDGPMTLRDSEP